MLSFSQTNLPHSPGHHYLKSLYCFNNHCRWESKERSSISSFMLTCIPVFAAYSWLIIDVRVHPSVGNLTPGQLILGHIRKADQHEIGSKPALGFLHCIYPSSFLGQFSSALFHSNVENTETSNCQSFGEFQNEVSFLFTADNSKWTIKK